MKFIGVKKVAALGVMIGVGFSLGGCAGFNKPHETLRERCLNTPVIYTNLNEMPINRQYELADGKKCTRIYRVKKYQGY